MQRKQINLNSVEATSYCWVETIKNKIREISLKDDPTKEEQKFYKLFFNFTDIEWRNLYLNLNKTIKFNVINYSHHEKNGIDEYQQDTSAFYHPDINKELSKIIKTQIPDISLSSSGIAESIIYTNSHSANRWYKNGGITTINNVYDSNYILSGNKNELILKNIIMAKIISSYRDSINNYSVEFLRNIVCDIYKKYVDNKIIIEDEFNRIFNQLNDEGLIIGLSCNLSYVYKFNELDLVGLNNCFDNKILRKK